jgi:hypothetical protein
MSKPSRYWPYIRSTAKVVKGLTGTPPLVGLGIDALIELQDTLATDKGEPQSEIKHVLSDILNNTRDIAQQLRGDELEDMDEETLGRTALSIAEALFLKRVADAYLYADFKGIEQLEKFISLKLDEIFVK